MYLKWKNYYDLSYFLTSPSSVQDCRCFIRGRDIFATHWLIKTHKKKQKYYQTIASQYTFIVLLSWRVQERKFRICMSCRKMSKVLMKLPSYTLKRETMLTMKRSKNSPWDDESESDEESSDDDSICIDSLETDLSEKAKITSFRQ